MEFPVQEDKFTHHLKSLWNQGSREVALAFLRRALTAESTLSEVLCALQFEGVSDHLEGLRLLDVVEAPAAAKPMPTPSPARSPVANAKVSSKGKRRRRSVEEMNQVRATLLELLGDEGQSMTTSEIVAQLGQRGHELDSPRASLLLKQMLSENLVVDLGGKPKAWRAASTAPQRSAEPMYIKKKQAS